MSATTQPCPQCGEDVLPAMVRCRGCGHRLIDVSDPPPAAGVQDHRTTAGPHAVRVAATTAAAGRFAPAADLPSSAAHASSSPAIAGLLVATCACGHRVRVKSEHAGRPVTCSKCGTAIFAAAESHPATAPTARFATFAGHAAAIEKKRPQVVTPVKLRKTQFAWKLNRLIRRLERQNGDNSDRATERRQAALELAATRDVRAVEAILPLMEDPWDVVRHGAALALGELGDASVVPALVRALDDSDPEVKREAIAALGKIGDGRAVPALLSVAVQQPEQRVTAIDALVKIGKPAVAPLMQALESRDTDLVLQALVVLQRTKATPAVGALTKALGHPLALIRAQAAEAIGAVSVRTALPALQKALNDINPAVRVAALRALRKCGDRKLVTELAVLLHDEDADVRQQALEAVGELGDASLTPSILPSLHHPSAGIRGAAVDALRKLGDEALAPQLLPMLTDRDEQVRVKAIAAICRFKCREAMPSLLELLKHPSWAVRAKAAEGLGEIGDPTGSSALQTTLRNDDVVEVRMAAAKSLGKIGDPRSIESLEAALHDEHAVRCRAITALGQMKARSSQAALLAMLRDPLPEVRFHAAQAIGEIGDANVVRWLEGLLQDDNPLVRRGAAKALIKLGDPRGEMLHELAERAPHVRGSRSGIVPRVRARVVLALISLLFMAGGGWGLWQFASSFRRATALRHPPLLRGRVASLALSADGQRVAVGRTRGLIEVWDLRSETIVERLSTGRIDEVSALAFSADGQSLLMACGASIFSVRQGQLQERASHKRAVPSIRTGPGSTHGVTWSTAADVFIWNLSSAAVEASLELKTANLHNLTVDANGQRLAWGQADGTIVVWNVAENEPALELKAAPGPIVALAFDHAGKWLVAVGPAIGLMVWNLATGDVKQHVSPIEPGGQSYQYVQCDSDGKCVLALRGRQVDAVWLENNEPPHTLTEGQGGQGDIVAIDPGATRLVSGDRESTAIWAFNLAHRQPPARLDVPPGK